ncbi:MarR family winged helix-turn-helix transcriptional regulator [Demetria terragena]|uniref:MarR family winged helix-turn-helix transcriptional regulator n=1 Tax=Demetria terragena TaxID=63959 RepID=UPI000368C725|nr:MarR family transcriptional regulator [Demetria terragena]
MTADEPTGPSLRQDYDAAVAAYVEAGGSESVQRVITAVHAVHRRLSRWYDDQLADLGLSAGEWAVISHMAMHRAGEIVTPSHLSQVLSIAPSSMTHRLDRMAERGLIERVPDEVNRTRILITLTDDGRQLFRDVIQQSDVMEGNVLGQFSEKQRTDLADLLERAVSGLDDALSR